MDWNVLQKLISSQVLTAPSPIPHHPTALSSASPIARLCRTLLSGLVRGPSGTILSAAYPLHRVLDKDQVCGVWGVGV